MMRDKGGEDWALGLRNKQRGDVREQLMALSGVGPKVGVTGTLVVTRQFVCGYNTVCC